MKWFCVKNIKDSSLIRNYLIFLAVFVNMNLFSQNEANNWHFGKRSSLNIELLQSPEVLFDSQMNTPAGCASISDTNGDLQIYTNGIMIFNKNHGVMLNGNLLQISPGPPILVSNKDVAQNSIIIPIIDSNNLYYVFSVGPEPEGLTYSIVDIGLANGLGEVIEKNIVLLPGTGVGKISAVHHADGKSIWVMTTKKNSNDSNTSFHAFKINTDGTIETPVISSGNLSFRGVPEGIIKFSPDGKKIACTNYQTSSLSDHLKIFDFDNQTGIVTNQRNVQTSFVFFEVVSAYGIEFSNDSKYLYASLTRQGMFDPANPDDFQSENIKKNLLYKYDTELVNISGSVVSLHEELSDLNAGSLQLSKNGNIYRALSKDVNTGEVFLGLVNNADLPGIESTYMHNAVNLSPNESRFGLPNFIQSYFRTRILPKEGCLGDSIFFEVDTYAEITDAQWDFGDGNTSSEISPSHVYTSTGSFRPTVTITINNRQITTSKEIIIHELPYLTPNEELIQCDTNSDGISVFNLFNITEKITNPFLNEVLYFYESYQDAELDINRILNPNNYTNTVVNQEIYVRVVNENDCFAITSFFINAVFNDLGAIPDVYTCEDSDNILGDSNGLFLLNPIRENIRSMFNLSNSTTITLYSTLFEAQTTTNNLRDFLISDSTTIWVRLEESDLSCSGIAPINLIVNSQPIIDLDEVYTLCGDNQLVLNGDSSNTRFEWLNSNNDIISDSQQFTSITTGSYTHIAYKYENGLECSSSETFVIERTDPPVFDIIEINTEPLNTIFVSVIGNGIYEFSINGISFFGNSNNYVFYNISAGEHTIYVRDINQCEPTIQKQVYIIDYPKFFTPNGDGVNDFWLVKGLDESLYQSIIIFDRFGKLIVTLNQQNGYMWDGRYNLKKLPSEDYWFKVVFNNGDLKTGHFTLKRE